MIDNTAEALDFVRKKGPILPSQLSTTINTNILFASAILSELVDKKKIKITHIKKGGSPFYYAPGQEEKLMDLAENLSGKLKEAYNLISDKQVIRDSDALPWQRVALRDLKDFVVAVSVNYSGNYETFWKWYLTSNEDAKEIIRKILHESKKKEPLEQEEGVEERNEEQKEIEERAPEPKEPVQKQIVEKKEKPKREIVEEDYMANISKYFEDNSIYIITQNIVRKGREFNFIVDVPSNLGQLRYFVKFKNKKTISDADLLSALDESNKEKLPLLYLTNGELTKKAQKYLDGNVSGKLIFKTIN